MFTNCQNSLLITLPLSIDCRYTILLHSEYILLAIIFFLISLSSSPCRSSIHSGIDVRSVTETEVNFARGVDTWSEASGPSTVSAGPVRSPLPGPVVHPDLTYTVPVLPDQEDEYPDTDFDDRMSARTGRSLARSASEFTEDWRHHVSYAAFNHNLSIHITLFLSMCTSLYLYRSFISLSLSS